MASVPFLFAPERAGMLDDGEWCVCSRTQMLLLPRRPSRSPCLPAIPQITLDFVSAMRSGPDQWLEMRAGDLLNWLCSVEDSFVGIEGVFVQRGLLAMAIARCALESPIAIGGALAPCLTQKYGLIKARHLALFGPGWCLIQLGSVCGAIERWLEAPRG